MRVICTDGTVLQCDRSEAIDSGALLFDEQRGTAGSETEDDEEEEAASEEANGFVPIHQLRFVLPDGVQPGRASGQPAGQSTPQPPAGAGVPPRGQPQGQMPPQQSMGGQPSPQGGQPGPGQNRR